MRIAGLCQFYWRTCFIISCFSFGFTSAYKSILFCCLRRNVKPYCNTYDLSWLCIVWERAWSLSRWRTTETVTLSRVALSSRIPAVYDQRYKCHKLRDGGRRPPATMFTTSRLLQHQQQAYRLRIAISAIPHLHLTPPLGGFPSEYRHSVWYGKIEWCGCPTVKKFRRCLYSFWHNSRTWQTHRQTDRHTHTQTPHDGIGRAYALHRAAVNDAMLRAALIEFETAFQNLGEQT